MRKSVQSVYSSCSEVTWEFQRFFPDQFRPLSQKLEPIEVLNFGRHLSEDLGMDARDDIRQVAAKFQNFNRL